MRSRREERLMPERFRDEQVLLSFNETVAYLRTSRSTLYRLMKAERLPGHKVGRKWVFFKGDVLRLLGAEEWLARSGPVEGPPGDGR